MIQTQHNAWLHAAATVAVAMAGFYFELAPEEWCWIILAMASVWTAEALNTAFEFLADVTTKDYHPVVEQAKDVAAGAVLITAMAAAIVGVIIFYPYVVDFFV